LPILLAPGRQSLYTGGKNTGGGDMARIDKENYYLDIADTVLKRSTCLRR